MTPDQLREIADPTERVRAARAAQTDLEKAFQQDREQYLKVIGEGVRELRQSGLSLAKIGVAIGVTPTRVQQLSEL